MMLELGPFRMGDDGKMRYLEHSLVTAADILFRKHAAYFNQLIFS
jgi:hypothetical protein